MSRLKDYFTQEAAPSVEVIAGVNPETVLAVEVAVTASNEALALADELIEDSEQLDTIASSLESLAIFAEGTIADGGLSRDGGAALHLATNLITASIQEENITPSVESFGGASERVQGTDVAVESITATVKKVWLAFKTAMMKTWDAIANWAKSLVRGTESIRKMAKELMGMDFGTKAVKDDAKIKLKSYLPKLHVGGKMDNVVTDADKLVTSLDGVLGAGYKTAVKIAAGIDVTVSGKDAFSQKITEAIDAFKGNVDTEMLGGRMFKMSEEKDGKKGYTMLMTEEFKGDVKAEMTPLAEADIKKLAEAAIKLADLVDGAQKQIETVYKLKTDAVKAIEDAIGKADDKDQKKLESEARMYLGKLSKAIDNPYQKSIAYALTSAKALVGFAEMNYKAHS